MKKYTSDEFIKESKRFTETNDSEPFWVFRGLKSSSYNCETSFSRLIKKNIEKILFWPQGFLEKWHGLLCNELKIELGVRNFEDKMVWQYVQHYYQKTNLLDVTIDPAIALSFALEELDDDEKKENSKFEECRVIAIKTNKQMYFAKQAHGENGYLVSLIDYMNYAGFGRKEIPLSNYIININGKIEKQKGAFLYCKIPFNFDYELYFLSDKFIGDYDLNKKNIYKSDIFEIYKKSISSEINIPRINGYDAGIIKSFTIIVKERKKINDTDCEDKNKNKNIKAIVDKYMKILEK